jgi:6-pyruvoyl-tetrahydropterin synthase related domain
MAVSATKLPVVMKPRSIQDDFLKIVVWVCFLKILFLLNAPAAGAAGRITLTVTSKARVSGRQVETDFIVFNQGTEGVRDVSIAGTFLGKSITTPVSQGIRPGESSTVTLRDTLPENFQGAAPLFAEVNYQDLQGTTFSNAAVAVVRTAPAPEPRVAWHVKKQVGRTRTALRVSLVDPSKALSEIVLTCHVSGDMTVSSRTKTVRLKNGVAGARFFIRGRGDKTGRYAVFVTAEYVLSGSSQLVYRSVPIEIGPAKKTSAFGEFGPAAITTACLLAIGIFSIALIFPRSRKRIQRLFSDNPWPMRVADGIVLIVVEGFILSYIHPEYLLTDTITTGGDTASHYYTLHYLRTELLPHLKITGWNPGNYAGFPMLKFYFPLPFLLMCALNVILPLQIAFKWVTLLGVFLLPIAAYVMLRQLDVPFPGPAAGAALTLPFLFNSETSAWGGNILSVLAGEFSYSLSLAITLFFLGSLYRGCITHRRVVGNACLVFLVGFSHGYTLLFAEAMSLFFLLNHRDFRRRFFYLFQVYFLGFLLLAFWLVPLLVYSKHTTPFHSAWYIRSIHEVFPAILLPVFLAAAAGSIGFLFGRRGNLQSIDWQPAPVLGFLLFGVVAAGLLYIWAPKLGVVDIRYIPCGQLIICLIAASCLGYFGKIVKRQGIAWAVLLLVVGFTVSWTGARADKISDWARWNYEGFESKSAWPLYQQITAALQGTFKDPRVVFEHSSKHNIFGSPRAFESLPLFAGRATLEGLYMQASTSAPFIFYLQSEISKQRSCPFKQYACTDLDVERAMAHLKMFNVRDVILRSDEAKRAVRNTAGFMLATAIGDYEIWSLDRERHRYVVPLKNEPVFIETAEWKELSYRWFTREDVLDTHLVFGPGASGRDKQPFKIESDSIENLKRVPIDTRDCRIRETILSDEIRIETNWIDKPLLIKMSYHPGWRVEGADRIYLASPSFMLIFPKQEHVRLVFGSGKPEWYGWGLTIAGLAVLLVNAPIPWRNRSSIWSIWRKRFGPVPGQRGFTGGRSEFPAAKRLFTVVLLLSVLAVVWTSTHVYRNEPNRILNQGIRLKDDRRYEKAREAFRSVLSNVSPISSLAEDSAYYIAICYYLESDYPSAIRAFKDLIAQFAKGRRTREALYHIGLCHFRLGQKTAGAERMLFLLKNHPESIWSGFARDRLIEHQIFY